ncbi:DUF294 nucleotidyltransferase-like domain-containing protein [Methylonatrum kenyense]|uniref:DUF294 nucleotidyltransferase-like domain-containing protein n=1 Tax=Methylonatrum kenyense TaxID=455253 RepID=UPI0020C11F0A|nr:DUF294 nucleotidyltransferase-like domain-containing protein [Methylonatrum kenyense]MCK8517076.1 DUF294 nucleotidyltransferase-like domain-containing protein [Methylonatrum kenyense]
MGADNDKQGPRVDVDREAIRMFLRQYPPFDAMSAEHLALLAERVREQRYAAGTQVGPRDGKPAQSLCIIRTGRVTGARVEDGRRLAADSELLPGECFPVGELLSGRSLRRAFQAEEDTVCLELDRADFQQLLRASDAFHAFCNRRLSHTLDRLLEQADNAGIKSLAGGDTSLDIQLCERLRKAPVTCAPESSIRNALQAMADAHVGSMVVVDQSTAPVGVFTLNDLLRRVALPEVDLDQEIGQVMSPDPVTLSSTAFAFEAAMVMAQNRIHHVCVVDEGRLRGVISERDLFSLQRVGLVNLTRTIRRATTVDALVPLQADIHALVGQMIDQGIKVGQIMQIITLLNDHICERVIELCMQDNEEDLSDVRFCWLAFGSEGRREQTLKTDQDNGILFEVPAGGNADAIRRRLLPVAERINKALDRCGYPLCPGNIMAGNPECCLSREEWQKRFRRWIEQGTPEHLLKAAIFFDFRVIHGPGQDAEEMRRELMELTRRNSRFRQQMAANALKNRPPLGIIRDFVTRSHGEQRNVIDLKINGVTPFVDAARIFSLAHGLPATNTVDRLWQGAECGALSRGDVEAWVIAYHYIQVLRTRQHQEQGQAGEELSNHVAPDQLNELDRKILKEAFREARKLQSKLASDYQL